jgi:hypothetical protein
VGMAAAVTAVTAVADTAVGAITTNWH